MNRESHSQRVSRSQEAAYWKWGVSKPVPDTIMDHHHRPALHLTKEMFAVG